MSEVLREAEAQAEVRGEKQSEANIIWHWSPKGDIHAVNQPLKTDATIRDHRSHF